MWVAVLEAALPLSDHAAIYYPKAFNYTQTLDSRKSI